MKQASLAAIVLGFVLLGLSAIASSLFSGRSMWSEEQASRRASNQERIFGLQVQLQAKQNGTPAAAQSHAPTSDAAASTGKDAATLQAELDKLKADQQALNDQFAAAHDRPAKFGGALRWSGILLAALGLIGWYAASQQR